MYTALQCAGDEAIELVKTESIRPGSHSGEGGIASLHPQKSLKAILKFSKENPRRHV